MPRYDYVFVIIEENESLDSARGTAAAVPYINAFFNQGNLFYNYYSTGDPSEPNYLALGSADDWGQTSDEAIPVPVHHRRACQPVQLHGCAGPYLAPLRGVALAVPGGHHGERSGCRQMEHRDRRRLLRQPDREPASWAVMASPTRSSHCRPRSTIPVIWFADVVAQPNFLSNERSIAGPGDRRERQSHPLCVGQRPASARRRLPRATGTWRCRPMPPQNNITSWWTGNTQPWTQDQFPQDLQDGDVANYNVIVPDQKDDMHDTGVVARADYFRE